MTTERIEVACVNCKAGPSYKGHSEQYRGVTIDVRSLVLVVPHHDDGR